MDCRTFLCSTGASAWELCCTASCRHRPATGSIISLAQERGALFACEIAAAFESRGN
jgi:hypothetical protein